MSQLDCRAEAPFLRRAWRLMAGRHAGVGRKRMPPLSILLQTEWSREFEQRMRDRLVMGALRYGQMGDPDKPTYDRISSVIRRLQAYRATGNLEHLVDAACLLLLEFVEGVHPLRHWGASDDGEHTRERVQ